jgi:hypothetical protein
MNQLRVMMLSVVLGASLLSGCTLGSGMGESASNASAQGPASLEPARMGPPSVTGPTVEQYLAYTGPIAQEVSASQMTIDGHPVSCGARPTVLNPKLDSWGGAFPGYLILNPERMQGLPTQVKFYIYYHECGHQFVGGSETGADCYSIHRGVIYGWLTPKGMDQVCAFISTLRGDAVHPPGPERCKLMRQCYAKAVAEKAKLIRSAANE